MHTRNELLPIGYILAVYFLQHLRSRSSAAIVKDEGLSNIIAETCGNYMKLAKIECQTAAGFCV